MVLVYRADFMDIEFFFCRDVVCQIHFHNVA